MIGDITGVPVHAGILATDSGGEAAAFVPVVSLGDIEIEAVVNDHRFGIGATAPIFGPIRAGLFGVSDYNLNIGIAAGMSFRF